MEEEWCIFGHKIPTDMYRAYINYRGGKRCICIEHDKEVFHGRLELPK